MQIRIRFRVRSPQRRAFPGADVLAALNLEVAHPRVVHLEHPRRARPRTTNTPGHTPAFLWLVECGPKDGLRKMDSLRPNAVVRRLSARPVLVVNPSDARVSH